MNSTQQPVTTHDLDFPLGSLFLLNSIPPQNAHKGTAIQITVHGYKIPYLLNSSIIWTSLGFVIALPTNCECHFGYVSPYFTTTIIE